MSSKTDFVFMNITSWNYRGAAPPIFIRHVKEMRRLYDIGIFAVFEPRISGENRAKVIRRLGFSGCSFVDAEGFSGGIWLLWDEDKWMVDVKSRSKYMIHSEVFSRESKKKFLLSTIYGSPQPTSRNLLWRELVDTAKEVREAWLVMGDFNAYLLSSEKMGSTRHDWSSMSLFADCLNQCDLMDMGCKGPNFTWEKGSLRERIDRACCNLQWQFCFPDAFVMNGLMFKSDHRPVVVNFGKEDTNGRGPRPFRFQAAWLTHNSFASVVEEAWVNNADWLEGSNKFTENVAVWNKQVFGDIFRRKRSIIRRLHGIERTLELYSRPDLVKLHSELWDEFNRILEQEEMLWFQKSRCNWLSWGIATKSSFMHLLLFEGKRIVFSC